MDFLARVIVGRWPGDRHQVADGAVQDLGVAAGLAGGADAHVDDDFLQPRHLHDVLIAELFLQGRKT